MEQVVDKNNHLPSMIPTPIDWDPADKSCSSWEYGMPEHSMPNGQRCPKSDSPVLVKEGQMEKEPGGFGLYDCPNPNCGQKFRTLIKD